MLFAVIFISTSGFVFNNARISTPLRSPRLSMADVLSQSSFDGAIVDAGGFLIRSAEDDVAPEQLSEASAVDAVSDSQILINLVDIKSGWGNGAHPTTRLCLDFLSNAVREGDIVLDYGSGSGILSIAAAKLGAKSCLAVEIDEDCLTATHKNAKLNAVDHIVKAIHTKTVYIGDDSFPEADVTVANILPGPLSRLVAPLWMLTKPGGQLCLSGLRPHELPAMQR